MKKTLVMTLCVATLCNVGTVRCSLKSTDAQIFEKKEQEKAVEKRTTAVAYAVYKNPHDVQAVADLLLQGPIDVKNNPICFEGKRQKHLLHLLAAATWSPRDNLPIKTFPAVTLRLLLEAGCDPEMKITTYRQGSFRDLVVGDGHPHAAEIQEIIAAHKQTVAGWELENKLPYAPRFARLADAVSSAADVYLQWIEEHEKSTTKDMA